MVQQAPSIESTETMKIGSGVAIRVYDGCKYCSSYLKEGK